MYVYVIVCAYTYVYINVAIPKVRYFSTHISTYLYIYI